MDTDHVETVTEGPIREIVMDRPEKKNAVTFDMYRGMAAALREADDDGEVRVILLRGRGDDFTSGNDLGDFTKEEFQGNDHDHPAAQFLGTLGSVGTPVVAAVEGYALGIGTTLLLHCDIVYAHVDTTFQLPFVNLGLTPEAGSSYLIPRAAGYRRAAELFFFAERFGVEVAREIGLLSDVVREGSVEEYARRRGRRLAEQPPAALREAKRLLREYEWKQLEAVTERETATFAERLASPELEEAVRAFMEDREPDFSQFA